MNTIAEKQEPKQKKKKNIQQQFCQGVETNIYSFVSQPGSKNRYIQKKDTHIRGLNELNARRGF